MKKSSTFVVIFLIIVVMFVTIFLILFPVKNRKVVAKISRKYNLEETLVMAVINVESGWDNNARSKSGAVGVMQVMPSTADEVAKKIDLVGFDLTDFETNVEIGCYYLRYLLDLFDDLRLALCAYNAGLNNVRQWLDSDEYTNDGNLIKIPFKETRDYVKKVSFNKKVYSILL